MIKTIEDVIEVITKRRNDYRNRADRWKMAFRCIIVASTVFSSLAAVTTKLDILPFGSLNQIEYENEKDFLIAEQKRLMLKSDIAAFFAITAGLLTAMIGLLEIETYWQSNRQARHRLDALLIEAQKTNAQQDEILQQLKLILLERADSISPGGYSATVTSKSPRNDVSS